MFYYALVLLLCSIEVLSAQFYPSTSPVDDHYIVSLNTGADLSAHIEQISNAALGFGGNNTFIVKYTYNSTLNGYYAKLTGAALDAVRSDPNVEYVEEDSIGTIRDEAIRSPTSRAGPALVNRSSSAFVPHDLGLGVDIYVVDSGIYTEHTEFGGRAHWGATFGTYFDGDFDGHGTLVSSMAVGAHYGVATAANVIAVKVWDHAKYAKISDVLASFEWLVAAYLVSENLGIVNLSWTADPSPSLTKAAIQTIAVGLHFIGAAGNEAQNARLRFPGLVGSLSLVGAVDRKEVFAKFSNYGPSVDEFALGVDVIGATIRGPTASESWDGTSASCAKVSGIIAIALSRAGQLSPYKMYDAVIKNSIPVVTGQPEGTTNLLAQQFPKNW